jgi:phenylacetate-CoA ligase
MAVVDKNQWLSRPEIEEIQFLKFKKIINHAYYHTKFYKDKFDHAGVHPRDIHAREDILKIPPTTKREILENFPHNLLANGYKLSNCHSEKTSGSSGLKLTVLFDHNANDFFDCIYGRALFAIGYKPWQAMAYFWPSGNHQKEFHEHIGLMRKDWISSDIRPEEQLFLLCKLKPRIIYCFPSIGVVLAKMIEKEKTKYSAIRPEFIILHAELLTEEARRYIESVFNCPVYNEYGATEFGFRMAWECKERKGMHIDADSVLMEFLKDGAPVTDGEVGDMVVTGLVNRAMPLIRYYIGDRGILSDRKCACGRGLPMVEAIEGRRDDFIKLPSGKEISPRALVPLIERYKDILEFRIVQKARDVLHVHVVGSAAVSEDIITKMRKGLFEIIDENVSISIEVVQELPRTERGKLRAVISEINETEK